jgi:hypothetical protein
MATRRNFNRNQKEQIATRATNADGQICCEGCGLVLAGKPYEIDHTIPEALRPEADKKQPITIAEGQLLGKACCHRGTEGKTNKDVKQIAKAKRQNAKHIGITRPAQSIQSAPFAKSEKAARRANKAPKPSLPPRPFYQERTNE